MYEGEEEEVMQKSKTGLKKTEQWSGIRKQKPSVGCEKRGTLILPPFGDKSQIKCFSYLINPEI